MTATEVRIGNYVMYSSLIQVNEHKILEMAEHPYRFAPIRLTEEWLERFGFKREDKSPTKGHSHYFSKWLMDYKYSFAYAPFREDWGFYHSYTDASNDEDNDKFDFISCGIKYVHQLQNLYFALSGTELTADA